MIKEGEQINRPFETNLIIRIVFSRLLETMSSMWDFIVLLEVLHAFLNS